jgi:hypothetical protein
VASTRELHLARARMDELKSRVAELGARLLESEQRSAELLRTRVRLDELELELERARDELTLSEAARERAEYSLACINASVSWRLTAPLRAVKRTSRWKFGR